MSEWLWRMTSRLGTGSDSDFQSNPTTVTQPTSTTSSSSPLPPQHLDLLNLPAFSTASWTLHDCLKLLVLRSEASKIPSGMATPRAIKILACIRSTATQQSLPPAKRQCLRSISSTTSYRQSGKRQLMTESAYRPALLDPPPPPPRNASVPNTSIAGGATHNLGTSSPNQKLSWTGSTLSSPTIKKDTPAIDISESEAQISKPVTPPSTASSNATPSPNTKPPTPQRPRRTLRPQKAAMTLTPTAIDRLRSLLASPTPKLIRVGVKNKGCSGSAYHLEYVESPGRFDEVVEQDGVKVLIDSKALIKVIGSEMDWVEDRLSQRFTFRNPNVTEQCGCGESFSVG